MTVTQAEAVRLLEANAEALQALPQVQGVGLREDSGQWVLAVYLTSENGRAGLPDWIEGTAEDGTPTRIRVVADVIGEIGLD